MNDLYFTAKNKKACKKITFAESVYAFGEWRATPLLHQSRSGWISSMQSIVYHQTAGKCMHGYAVMIYSSRGADEMHAKAWWYTKPAVWIKKVVSKWYDFFGADDRDWTCTGNHRILSPARLPVPPHPHNFFYFAELF